MCLQSHYRKQLTFSYDSLDTSENAYKKLKNRTLSLTNTGDVDNNKYEEYNNKFKECLEDDLNTSNALSTLYDVLKSDLNDSTKYKLVMDFDKVLGLDLLKEDKKYVDEEFISKKIDERNIAKQNKDYATADSIRNELLEMGIVLKDTREGTTYEVR